VRSAPQPAAEAIGTRYNSWSGEKVRMGLILLGRRLLL
jgi:hypothetical protein